MKNHNDMTLNECREELAGFAGFHRITKDYFARVPLADFRGNTERFPNPIPPTLDAIASAMPEGWRVFIGHYDQGWNVHARKGNDASATVDGTMEVGIDDNYSDTEILARARLAVACHRAQAGGVK